jgi:hypothetical protein
MQISCSVANEKAVSKNLEGRGQMEFIQEEEQRESKRRMDIWGNSTAEPAKS